MPSLSGYGITLEELKEMHQRWKNGEAKSTLEIEYLGRTGSHGKLFTSLIRTHLGIETERKSKTVIENERLRVLLRSHGINPDSKPK
jgi:hypothetical protein